jgi:hypothetical protein
MIFITFSPLPQTLTMIDQSHHPYTPCVTLSTYFHKPLMLHVIDFPLDDGGSKLYTNFDIPLPYYQLL